MTEAVPALREYSGIIANAVTTVSLPAVSLQVGDYIVACIMHRSALTVPSGWTLRETVGPISGDAATQQLSILSYAATTAGSVTPSFTQASSGRMSAAAFRLRNVQSVSARTDLRIATLSYSVPNAVVSASKGTARTIIWAVASTLYVSGATTQWASSPAATSPAMSGAASGNEPRMAGFFDFDESTGTRTFTPASGTAASSGLQVCAVEVVGISSLTPKRYLNVGGTATAIQ